jgi:hypothetical protein
MIISTPKPKFQQITEKLKRELFAAKLTSVEWRLWFYLFTIDLASAQAICAEFGVEISFEEV